MAAEKSGLGFRRAFLKVSAVLLGGMLMPAGSSAEDMLERRIPRTGEPTPAVGALPWTR